MSLSEGWPRTAYLAAVACMDVKMPYIMIVRACLPNIHLIAERRDTGKFLFLTEHMRVGIEEMDDTEVNAHTTSC